MTGAVAPSPVLVNLRLRRWAPLRALVLAAALLCSACQATIHVGVDIRQDGRGSVTVTATLDQQAAAYAPDVRTSDLVHSGWTVVGPSPTAGGGVTFTASKPFADPAQAKVVVAQLSGSNGPFRNLAIGSRHSFFRTTTTFQGTVDLSCGLKCFSDPQLQQALGGSNNLGIDPSTLQSDAGIILDRLFQFEVAARLPGPVQSNALNQVGNGALWKVALGQKAVLAARARSWNKPHIVLVAGGVVVVVLGGSFTVAGVVKRRRHRRRTPRSAGARRGRVREAVTPPS